jgi:DNA-binding cell septation regulator SpoVG
VKITAEKREAGRFTFYTVRLHSAEGKEPFLEIKDCKLIDGSKGQFVGFPARKDDKDKWWPMVYASDGFQAEVIKVMNAATVRPTDTRTLSERRPKPPTSLADMVDDVPW